jgi:hypothetical protein
MMEDWIVGIVGTPIFALIRLFGIPPLQKSAIPIILSH